MANIALVINMVRGFHDIGNLANPRTARIIPEIRDLLNSLEFQGGWETIFLRDLHRPDDPVFKTIPVHCVQYSEETEIVEELRPFQKFPVIDKSHYSGFYQTQLHAALAIWRPGRVLVVGVCTDICVLHTVAGLRERGYNVVVHRDCVETYDAPNHPAEETSLWALRHMEDILGAKIIP